LPLTAAMPAVAQSGPLVAGSAARGIPNRVIPVRQRGPAIQDCYPPTDGTSDCSAAINHAISLLPSDGGTVIVHYQAPQTGNDCIYMIDTTANNYVGSDGHTRYYGINLRSNMMLQFEPGVILQAMPNSAARAYIILGQNINNVEIANGSIIGERYQHTPSSGGGTDEWGMGLELLGSSAITVRATSFSNCNGDGICLGGGSDAVFCGVTCTGNRRQGMSIVGASDVQIYNSEFSYTQGTNPQDGIDIEPDGTGVSENITIDNCVFRGNMGAGLGLNGMHGATIKNLMVTNCTMCYNGSSGFYSYQADPGIVDGGQLYGNAIYQNKYIGLYLDHNTKNYTIGGSSQTDPLNNSFANNETSQGIVYPTPTEQSKKGYVAREIGADSNAQLPANNNVVNFNNFYS
ncbi:MAG TPA: right-handed parallel beta-helix repeat-containing protein, partial [Edaphobacter sp.]|nr:right-handed parallel beta-helix repeat-containing protein [Edaphobacter sp.]